MMKIRLNYLQSDLQAEEGAAGERGGNRGKALMRYDLSLVGGGFLSPNS